MAVVGAAVAVLANRAAELRHRHDDDVTHARAEVLRERGDGVAEVAEVVGELSLRAPLAGVRVPAADVGEGDLEADVRLDQLGDLLQGIPEGTLRIVGPVLRGDLARVGRLQDAHRVEGLLRRTSEGPGHGFLVHGLE